MSTLKSKTLVGILWSFTDSFGTYFIRFGFSIAIARTLAPSDYGLMGMIIIFIAIGNLLAESGFGMALIQKKDVTNIDFSTIFYFNFLVSILIYLILFFSAPLIAEFYNEKILVNVIRIAAISIIIGGLTTIQTTILSKEINFKKQSIINLGATLISGITGVTIAYRGFAVWALVFQTLAGNIVRLTILWITSNWKPSLVFSWKSFGGLYKYGYKIFLSGFIDIIFTKIYFPLIGKLFSATQLGFYTNASSLSEILVKQTTNAYGRVLFPALSAIQNNKDKLIENYCSIFRMLSFVMIPVTIIAILSSRSFIDFFLTSKWLSSVPYIQLLLIEGFFFALYMLNINTFYATGYSGISLRIEIFKKILLFISIVATFNFGIKALIIGQEVSSFMAFVFSLLYFRRKMNLKFKGLLIELLKLLVISIIIYFVDRFFLSNYIKESGLLLLSKILVLSLLYFLLVYILKVKALNDICSLFDKIIPKKIQNIIKLRLSD